MSKILALTGLTGKSGGVMAEELNRNKEVVEKLFPDGIRVLVRETANTKNLENLLPDASKCVGDLEDESYLCRCFANVDTVVHVAGIHWSQKVVNAAAASGVRRLILVHTTGIYSQYKAAGEEYRQIDAYVYKVCRHNDIVLTILRPTMIYGNAKDRNIIRFVKMVDKLPIMPVVNKAKYELQPVHYSDLGKAYYAVLVNEHTTAGRDFILSGKQPILLSDIFKVIGQNLGKSVRFISVPYWIAYSGSWVIYCISIGRIDMREKVQRLCEPRAYPHEEAVVAFGYDPMSFEEGIVQEVKDYREGK